MALRKLLHNLGLLLLCACSLMVWVKLPLRGAVALAVGLVLWLCLSRSGRQALSVTHIGIGTLRQRLGSSSVIVVGAAGVVSVWVAILATSTGFRATLQNGGSDDTAIILHGGAIAESQSVLLRKDVDVIEQAPGIARDTSGKPLVSVDLLVPVGARSRGSDDETNIQLRGVDDAAWLLHPGLVILEGRKFKPGLRELVVGVGAESQFSGLGVGDDVKIGAQPWKVVGVFASEDAYASELWADRKSVASAYDRGDTASSVEVKLTGARAFEGFNAALSDQPSLKVEVETSRHYFERQSERLSTIVRGVGLIVGIVMGAGAVFGALNCMFAAVVWRSKEIATLRAIGFGGTPVVVSVMLESLVLASLGGVLGALLVRFILNDHSASTLGGFNAVMFRFRVTPDLMWTGLKWAVAISLIGGLFPAARAARLQVAAALREA